MHLPHPKQPAYVKERQTPQPFEEDYPPSYYEASQDVWPGPSVRHTPAAPPASASNLNQQFPTEFNLYHSSSAPKNFTLGQHQDQPFYSVSTRSGLSSDPDVVLHSTIHPSSQPLATAKFKTFSSDIICALPPVSHKNVLPTDIRMDAGSGVTRSWSFAVEISNGNGGLARSTFEWQQLSGEEVTTLSGPGTGFKLVHTARPGSGAGPRAGDGNEVVAFFSTTAMSATEKMQFRFVGSGEAGILGERWSVMAVISALGIWEKERRKMKNHD